MHDFSNARGCNCGTLLYEKFLDVRCDTACLWRFESINFGCLSGIGHNFSPILKVYFSFFGIFIYLYNGTISRYCTDKH